MTFVTPKVSDLSWQENEATMLLREDRSTLAASGLGGFISVEAARVGEAELTTDREHHAC